MVPVQYPQPENLNIDSLTAMMRKKGRQAEDDVAALIKNLSGNRAKIAMLVARGLPPQKKIEFLQCAAKHGFADAWIQNTLATLLARIGKGEEAEREAREGVRIAPLDPYCRNTLAGILMGNGKGEEAERELTLTVMGKKMGKKTQSPISSPDGCLCRKATAKRQWSMCAWRYSEVCTRPLSCCYSLPVDNGVGAMQRCSRHCSPYPTSMTRRKKVFGKGQSSPSHLKPGKRRFAES